MFQDDTLYKNNAMKTIRTESLIVPVSV